MNSVSFGNNCFDDFPAGKPYEIALAFFGLWMKRIHEFEICVVFTTRFFDVTTDRWVEVASNIFDGLQAVLAFKQRSRNRWPERGIPGLQSIKCRELER